MKKLISILMLVAFVLSVSVVEANPPRKIKKTKSTECWAYRSAKVYKHSNKRATKKTMVAFNRRKY